MDEVWFSAAEQQKLEEASKPGASAQQFLIHRHASASILKGHQKSENAPGLPPNPKMIGAELAKTCTPLCGWMKGEFHTKPCAHSSCILQEFHVISSRIFAASSLICGSRILPSSNSYRFSGTVRGCIVLLRPLSGKVVGFKNACTVITGVLGCGETILGNRDSIPLLACSSRTRSTSKEGPLSKAVSSRLSSVTRTVSRVM